MQEASIKKNRTTEEDSRPWLAIYLPRNKPVAYSTSSQSNGPFFFLFLLEKMSTDKPPDPTRIATFCISLSSLIPESHTCLVPLLRNASQQYGDLMHRTSLLLNYHYTRLCELPEGFPLFHAPMASPFLIVAWAQKLISNPQWTNQNDQDREVLEWLRASLTSLETRLATKGEGSLIMPGAIGTTLPATVASADVYRTNAKEHLVANFDNRLRSTFFRLFIPEFEGLKIPKGDRKQIYDLVSSVVTQEDGPIYPLWSYLEDFVRGARASLWSCCDQARALVYYNADRKREEKKRKRTEENAADPMELDDGGDEDVNEEEIADEGRPFQGIHPP